MIHRFHFHLLFCVCLLTLLLHTSFAYMFPWFKRPKELELTSHSRTDEQVWSGPAITHQSVSKTIGVQRTCLCVARLLQSLEGSRSGRTKVLGPVGGDRVRPGTFETEGEDGFLCHAPVPPHTHVGSRS